MEIYQIPGSIGWKERPFRSECRIQVRLKRSRSSATLLKHAAEPKCRSSRIKIAVRARETLSPRLHRRSIGQGRVGSMTKIIAIQFKCCDRAATHVALGRIREAKEERRRRKKISPRQKLFRAFVTCRNQAHVSRDVSQIYVQSRLSWPIITSMPLIRAAQSVSFIRGNLFSPLTSDIYVAETAR